MTSRQVNELTSRQVNELTSWQAQTTRLLVYSSTRQLKKRRRHPDEEMVVGGLAHGLALDGNGPAGCAPQLVFRLLQLRCCAALHARLCHCQAQHRRPAGTVRCGDAPRRGRLQQEVRGIPRRAARLCARHLPETPGRAGRPAQPQRGLPQAGPAAAGPGRDRCLCPAAPAAARGREAAGERAWLRLHPQHRRRCLSLHRPVAEGGRHAAGD